MKDDRSFLQRLVGRELSGVVFVRDYLQLQFDSDVMTFAGWPVVVRGDERTSVGALEYRNRLCECINRAIKTFQVDDEQFAFAFENGTELRLSLRREDRTDPEMVRVDLEDAWGVW